MIKKTHYSKQDFYAHRVVFIIVLIFLVFEKEKELWVCNHAIALVENRITCYLII